MNKGSGKFKLTRKNVKYPKLERALFHDTPYSSAQDTAFNRITDTSRNVVYPTFRYRFIKNIGDGSASVIYLAVDTNTGREVIVKKIKKNNMWIKELNILNYLRDKTSDRVLKLTDFYENQRRSYLVTDFYRGLDLFEHVDINTPYPPKKGLLLLREMALGLKECHDNGILHLDIKCENYVVSGDRLFEGGELTGKVVLIDFGHSEYTENIENLWVTYKYGTDCYVCPEGEFLQVCSAKSDIWSLGICASMIFTGYFPFEGEDEEYYRNGYEGKIVTRVKDIHCRKITEACLSPEPQSRPSIDMVLESIEYALTLL